MKKLVGIDLAPAAWTAPGTARHVSGQARALFNLDVPWSWLPTFESPSNPLYKETEGTSRLIVAGRKFWSRATFRVGAAWKQAGCHAAFCTAYFVPTGFAPVAVNFFDSNIYDHFKTWTGSGKLLNAILIRFLSTCALHRAKLAFVNSNYCIQSLASRFPKDAGKLVLAPPGIIPPETTTKAKRPGWLPEGDFIFYVGVFSENKNQRRLIESYSMALGRSPGLPTLVLAGSCDSNFNEKVILPALSRCPNPSKIVLPGRISEDNLIWCYQNALAYIQPSIAEGFGLPIIEAMSYGLPVACSNTTSLPETAGGAALLFDPFATDSIADSIERLSFNSTLRRNLAESGSNRWHAFTWDANAAIIAANIENLLR